MAFVRVGRDHRVEEDHEARLHVRKCPDAPGEVTPGRSPRHPHFRGVDVQFRSHRTHHAQRLVGIVARNLAVAVGQAVFHHRGRDAVPGEPLGLLMSVADRERRIAAPGEKHERLSRGHISAVCVFFHCPGLDSTSSPESPFEVGAVVLSHRTTW